MTERTNEEWLAVLREESPARDQALADLRALLLRGMGSALGSRTDVREADLEDFVQEALVKILRALDSFRGESRFTTWAHKIAIRVAFTELRRRRWRDVSLDEILEPSESNFVPETLADPTAGPEQQTIQHALLETMERVIGEELTERQRLAMIAVRIHGMPLEEVARRMGTNRNALYKLLYDARQRLKKRLLAEGISPQEILHAFDSWER